MKKDTHVPGGLRVGFWFVLVLLWFTQPAGAAEYPYLYKDSRALGMGGAGIAVGGSAAAVFYNPAGLARINPDHGIEADIIGVSVSYNENVEDFFDAIEVALDTTDLNGDGDDSDDQLLATVEVLDRFQGQALHMAAANLTSIASKTGRLAWALGHITQAHFDARTHQGFGVQGLLEVDAGVTRGPWVGAAWDFMGGDLQAGFAIKALSREAVLHNFSSRELVDQQDDLQGYITDTLAQEGNATALDFGVIYRFQDWLGWQPSVGVSLMDAGDTDFGDAGTQPMTANVGGALRSSGWLMADWTLAMDIVDVARNIEADGDWGKRSRVGLEGRFFDAPWFGLALRAGVYQGSYTAGADVRLAILRIQYTTYAEEIGAYMGQDTDRRHLVNLHIGW